MTAKPNLPADERDPNCPDCGGYGQRAVIVQDSNTGEGREDQEPCDCQPAPAASGEADETLLRMAVAAAAAMRSADIDGWPNLMDDLAARLRTALADVASRDRIIASWKREEEAWHEREKSLKADVARLTRELFKAQDGIADIIRRTEDDTQERIRAAAEAAVKEAQRDDVLFTAFVFGFLRRDLEKRSCLPPPEWYSEDSMIAMILEAIRARAEKE